MSINNISGNIPSINSYKSNDSKVKAEANDISDQLVNSDLNNDQVEITPVKETVTNKVYTQDTAKINYLKQVAENNANTLKQMVSKLLSNQSDVGKSLLNINESYFSFKFDFSFEDADTKFNFNFNYEKYDFSSETIAKNDGMVKIDQATRDEAAGLISEDGPLGVKQVTENIIGFAKALSGGNPEKINLLKDAFIKGYNEVADLFGGTDKMPEISKKTYDAVLNGFNEWANENKSIDMQA